MRSRYRCSMCPAIHINSRSWLRSSSTREPSDPPLRVVSVFRFLCRSRKPATTTIAAPARRDSWDNVYRTKNGHRKQCRGGRKTIVGSLNLRYAVCILPTGSKLISTLRAIETGTPTPQQVFTDQQRNEYDSQRPVFTSSTGRPRRTPEGVRQSTSTVSVR